MIPYDKRSTTKEIEDIREININAVRFQEDEMRL